MQVIHSFRVPLAPSANVYWRKFRNRMVISEEAVAYKAAVLALALERDILPVPGDVALSLEIHFTIVTSDLDNRIKVCLDALNGIAYLDDRQVVELHAYKHFVPKKIKRGDKREGYIIVSIGKPEIAELGKS